MASLRARVDALKRLRDVVDRFAKRDGLDWPWMASYMRANNYPPELARYMCSMPDAVALCEELLAALEAKGESNGTG